MSGKVLLVDDSSQTRNSIKDALKGLFSHFIEADDGLGAIKVFVEEKPGFIITDVEMPSINGYRFISTVRGMDDGKDVPIMLISGKKDSLNKKLTGFNLGASDFLLKPYDDEELVVRVKSLLRVRNLMDELKEKNALLQKLAETDDLTGLNNRRHFFEAIKHHSSLGIRHNFKIACLLVDIDHFKRINDTYGHTAGDEVLKKISRLFNSCKRDGELLARFGGEEFILCLFKTDTTGAALAGERFRNIVKNYDFSSDSAKGLRNVTVSVGVAIYPHDAISSIDELIKAADLALYKSKSEGRDKVSVFEWTMNSQANA